MKKLVLALFSLLIYSESRCQTQVADKHPLSQIFAINYQTGQEDPATSDQAILFKNAFIDLVAATKYNADGKFPFTLLVDETGKVLKTRDGFPGGAPDQFVSDISGFQTTAK